jgi:hypothetical protein
MVVIGFIGKALKHADSSAWEVNSEGFARVGGRSLTFMIGDCWGSKRVREGRDQKRKMRVILQAESLNFTYDTGRAA